MMTPALAQQSQRELQELKNYSPPPMFGAPPPPAEIIPPPPAFTPPVQPQVQAQPQQAQPKPQPEPPTPPPVNQINQVNKAQMPSAETLLQHPVTVVPTPDRAVAVPVVPTTPVEAAQPPAFIAPPAPPTKRAEAPAKAKTTELKKKAEPAKKSEIPKANTSRKTESPKEKVEKPAPKKTSSPAPKISAARTRPVDQEVLPPLPSAPQAPSPSPSEKIIDQSIQNHLVEADADDVAKKVAPPGAASGKSVLRVTPPSVEQRPTLPIPLPLVTVAFSSALTDLQRNQEAILRSDVLPKLQADKKTRLQILAYASGKSSDGQSAARRTSLARGLSVRSWFLQQGIESGRMDVRAMGANTRETPADRVDLLVIK